MPNLCNYEMKIKGSKKAIKRVLDCLKADYNYNVGKPSHKHFFRVFEVNDEEDIVENNDGTFTQFVWGDCAWSVNSCMCRDGYYSQVKNNHKDIFMGTTLEEQSKDCEIEVFSEEEGVGFSEHYLYDKGVCLCDDCVDIKTCDENGKTIEDFDTYDGDLYTNNPNRECIGGVFNWSI